MGVVTYVVRLVLGLLVVKVSCYLCQLSASVLEIVLILATWEWWALWERSALVVDFFTRWRGT